MKCFSSAELSLYQDGALSEERSRIIADHLMSCMSCQEKMRSLGRANLFLRIELARRGHAECMTEEELGAYLTGTMSLVDRRRVEVHLVSCPRCLHEVAILSDSGVMRRSSASPVPDAKAFERFKNLPGARPAPKPKPSVIPVVFRRVVRVAAAVLLVALAFTQFGKLKAPVEMEATVVVDTSGGASRLYAANIVLTSMFQPDNSDLARLAGEVSMILRDLERISERPSSAAFELVRDDVLRSGVVETVTRLTEVTTDTRDRQFLRNCDFLLMEIAKAEGKDLKVELAELVEQVRLLNLVEAAQLVEMEGGGSRWPSDLL